MRDISDYSENYVNLPFEQYQVKYRRKKVMEQISKYSHKSILEVGCGMEPLFLYYADYMKMTIVEPSDLFCDHAEKMIRNGRGKTGHVCIIRGLLESKVEVLKREQYDRIIVSGLLHELEDPAAFLETVREVCSDATVVHINVPNAKSLHRILAMEAGLIADVFEKSLMQKRMQQHSTFDVKSLSELLESSGFQVIEQGSYFPKLFTHRQMQQLLDNGIIDEQILDGLYNMGKYLPEYGSEIYLECQKRQ